MNLNAVIAQLRDRVPELEGRVAGAATFAILQEGAALKIPCAYVVPLDDNADQQLSSNGYRQSVDDSFAVIVALSNKVDERGQAAAMEIHDMRARLFAALLGWSPDEFYDKVEYEGGSMLHMDRARMYYQFEFKANFEIGTEDTWIDAQMKALPKLAGVHVRVDAIDPADPNHPKQDFPEDPAAYPGGSPGPDGRAEGGATIDLPQN